MSVVYLARQTDLPRQVAVKILFPQAPVGSPMYCEFLERFRREAQLIATLEHTNIVVIHDYKELADMAYLVMPYFPRRSLGHLLEQRGSLSQQKTLIYIEQAAAALDYAHTRGVIHRDLKPSNFLLHTDGHLVLTDFGIAHIMRTTSTDFISNPAIVLGTPQYMAPEMIRKEPVDHHADIYELGIVLFQMLSGHVPFEGNMLMKHLQEPMPLLYRINPAISPRVDEVIGKATAKRPQERYHSAGELASDLRIAIEGPYYKGIDLHYAPTVFVALHDSMLPLSQQMPLTEEVHVPPPVGSMPSTPKMLPQNIPYVIPKPTGHVEQPAPRPVVPKEGSLPERRGPHIGKRLLLIGLVLLVVIAALVTGGGAAWFAIEHLPTSATPPTVVPQPTSIQRPQSSTPVANKSLIHPGPGEEYTVSWSPDGTKIASAGNGGIIEVWDPVTGNSLFNREASSIVFSVAWSPDGTKIASGQKDGTVKIWDATNGSLISTLTGHSGQVNSVAWSSDSRYIVSGSGDHTARVWDVASGNTITTYRGHSRWVNGVAWSHNSSLIVSGSGDKTAQVWDAFSGSHMLTYSRHTNEVLALAWSPDNSRIASASDDYTVQIWDATNGNLFVNYTGHSGFVVTMGWSPNGQYIASGGVDTTVQVWKATDGTTIYKYTGHSAEVEGVSWSADSKCVASASRDKTVQIWQASS